MGATRITQGMIAQRMLFNLNAQSRRILTLQDRLSTGLRVNRPSDDPIATRAAIDIRGQIQQNEQFISNVSDANPFVNESGSTLQRMVDIIQRVRELTLQGANGTTGPEQLTQIALEIDQLLEASVVAANQKVSGRSLFAGTATLSDAFAVTRTMGEITAVTYAGNSKGIEIAISEGARVTINEPGDLAFQGAQDVFQLLIDIRDDLRAGNQGDLQSIRLTELDSVLEQTLQSGARLGALQNRMDRVTVDKEDFVLSLQELLSDKIDADFADTIVNLNVQSNAFSAALNAAGRVIQPSLLDFIR